MTRINKKPQQTAAPTSSKLGLAPKQAPTRKSRRTKPRILALQAVPAARTSKRDQLSKLLLRDEGATIQQMCGALGWLPHTVRAALTGLKKLGYSINSDKIDGLRAYRAVASK